MQKLTLKWSKKEKDWVCDYPDNAGKNISGGLFVMIRKYEDFMSVDWQGKPTDYIGFRETLDKMGYDPDSFKITVKKKKQ